MQYIREKLGKKKKVQLPPNLRVAAEKKPAARGSAAGRRPVRPVPAESVRTGWDEEKQAAEMPAEMNAKADVPWDEPENADMPRSELENADAIAGETAGEQLRLDEVFPDSPDQ